jgi:hypothetical protein
MYSSPHTPPLERRARYYILRVPGNTMVPLVPIDQLPYQLEGVPSQLSHRQMCEDSWKYVDEVSEPVSVFPIVMPQQTNTLTASSAVLTPPKFLAPDHQVRGLWSHSPSDISKNWRSRPLSNPVSGELQMAQNPPYVVNNNVSEHALVSYLWFSIQRFV